jgi:hypothetical protein
MVSMLRKINQKLEKYQYQTVEESRKVLEDHHKAHSKLERIYKGEIAFLR